MTITHRLICNSPLYDADAPLFLLNNHVILMSANLGILAAIEGQWEQTHQFHASCAHQAVLRPDGLLREKNFLHHLINKVQSWWLSTSIYDFNLRICLPESCLMSSSKVKSFPQKSLMSPISPGATIMSVDLIFNSFILLLLKLMPTTCTANQQLLIDAISRTF